MTEGEGISPIRLQMEGLPPRRSGAIRGIERHRVHPPLPDARAATRFSPHPLLRPADQPNPRRQHRPYPRVARSSTHRDRRHQGRLHKGFDKRSARRAESARASLPLLRQPHAHHRDLLAGATAQCFEKPSAPPDAASGEGQVRQLMTISKLATPKSRSPVWSRLCRPRLNSLRSRVHHPTAAPIFTDTPAEDQKNASPPTCNAILTAYLAAPPISPVARP